MWPLFIHSMKEEYVRIPAVCLCKSGEIWKGNLGERKRQFLAVVDTGDITVLWSDKWCADKAARPAQIAVTGTAGLSVAFISSGSTCTPWKLTSSHLCSWLQICVPLRVSAVAASWRCLSHFLLRLWLFNFTFFENVFHQSLLCVLNGIVGLRERNSHCHLEQNVNVLHGPSCLILPFLSRFCVASFYWWKLGALSY